MATQSECTWYTYWIDDLKTFEYYSEYPLNDIEVSGHTSSLVLISTTFSYAFGDSVAPIERYSPYRLPRPWGQLGIIGISADRRGQGLGAALLDAGLRRLHNNGVNGCIIDWTDLVDFYAKFGFTPHRAYYMLNKQI